MATEQEGIETIKSLLCSLITGVEKERERKIGNVTKMSTGELQARLTKGLILDSLRQILLQALIVTKQSANEQ